MNHTRTSSSAPGASRRARRSAPRIPELYHVIVQCRDEAEQREVFERMQREGRKCRLVLL